MSRHSCSFTSVNHSINMLHILRSKWRTHKGIDCVTQKNNSNFPFEYAVIIKVPESCRNRHKLSIINGKINQGCYTTKHDFDLSRSYKDQSFAFFLFMCRTVPNTVCPFDSFQTIFS